MKYLFIGAHTDDVEASCGGTMTKLYELGHDVSAIALSFCDKRELLKEYTEASEILGVNFYNMAFKVRLFPQQSQMIADALLQFPKTDFVFTHSVNCRHPDHRTTAEESLRVFNCGIATYIQPWNGADTENYFVELSQQQLDKKIAALSCYKSQSHRPYMNPDFIRSQAIVSGIKCGKKYAEGFKVNRLIQ
jgi:N-acetylglucosamine malate deacetylase 1